MLANLNAGVIEYVGNVALLVHRRPVERSSGRRVVVVVVDVVRGLPHAGGRGHHGHRLVVPDLAAAASALEDRDEATTVFLVEESVEDRVDAGVTGAEPLGDRRGDRQDLVLPLVTAEFDHREDHVERQPRQHEQDHDHHQHLHHLHLRLLLYPLHLSVLRVGRDVPSPYLDPDQDVAE